MTVTRDDMFPLLTPEDIVRARQNVRSWAVDLGFSLVDQTKIVTAVSELARNTIIYGGGGQVKVESVDKDGRPGLRITFEDQGPGIADVELALRDGYSTGGGLGLGLSGSRRLSNEFEIQTAPGQGTRITITRWKG